MLPFVPNQAPGKGGRQDVPSARMSVGGQGVDRDPTTCGDLCPRDVPPAAHVPGVPLPARPQPGCSRSSVPEERAGHGAQLLPLQLPSPAETGRPSHSPSSWSPDPYDPHDPPTESVCILDHFLRVEWPRLHTPGASFCAEGPSVGITRPTILIWWHH